MEKKKTTPAPQQTPSVEEIATSRLKQAHSKLMEVQAEINKADELLAPASAGTLDLEELHKVSCRLHYLMAYMDSNLSSAAFYAKGAMYTTDLALWERKDQEDKRPYTRPAVGAVRDYKQKQ